jgi:hypothetical protein
MTYFSMQLCGEHPTMLPEADNKRNLGDYYCCMDEEEEDDDEAG